MTDNIYYLKDIHYEKCCYFNKEINGENFNVFNDFLLNDSEMFNRELIIDVLDYLEDNNIIRLKKYNINNLKRVFDHIGCDEGFYLDNPILYEKELIDIIDEMKPNNNNILLLKNNEKYSFNSYIKEELICKYVKEFIKDIKLSRNIFKLLNYDETILDTKYNTLNHFTFENYCDKIIQKSSDFNEIIKKNLSNNFTHLTFGNDFDQVIEKDVLPNSLTHLTFGRDYNQVIEKDVLPNSLTHLTFEYSRFNQIIEKDVLPNSLTHLTFGYACKFDQIIEKDVLPDSLTHLTFGCYYNQMIEKDVLPNSLTHLIFGIYFYQVIEKDVLPDSLTHLIFGKYYNQVIEKDVLPDSLTHLVLPDSYEHDITHLSKDIKIKYIRLSCLFL